MVGEIFKGNLSEYPILSSLKGHLSGVLPILNDKASIKNSLMYEYPVLQDFKKLALSDT